MIAALLWRIKVMFDFLLGLSAIVNAAIEVVTIKEANALGSREKPDYLKTDYEKSVEFYEEREAKMAEKVELTIPEKIKKYETVWDRKRRKFHEEELKRIREERMNRINKQPENPLAIWVVNHDDMILDVLKSGVHVIPYKDLDDLDPDMVAEFLFKTETVEKVEKVTEGLEVTVR